ncbi:MAG: acyl-CoA desaturase [Flavipsychrobacter sp.]|nr:acyl-CoA desaturase [Flavipsychrobacter sp.]
MSKVNIVRFAHKNGEGFYDSLKKRIDEFFKENNIAPTGNSELRWKTVAMVSLFFVPYIFIVTGFGASSPALFYGLWAMMGFGMIGVGCGVHHDSNHGSYSSNKTVNKVVGDVVNLVGGYDVTWRIQHNILHHTYTNIEGLDEDIDTGGLLRFSPHAKKHFMHRFQHIYGWFLYCLLTIQWVTYKDYRLLFIYNEKGLLKKEKLTLGKALLELSIYKVIYFTYILVLPIMYSGMPWQSVVAGFFLLHFIAGLGLSCIFQLAHVLESSEFPLPSEDRKMENNWAVHQMLNTANFSPRSYLTFWFVGGLNYQVEHHLFPHISHVHYPQISKIVKKTAEEYGVPYKVMPSFMNALVQHWRMLKKMGTA